MGIIIDIMVFLGVILVVVAVFLAVKIERKRAEQNSMVGMLHSMKGKDRLKAKAYIKHQREKDREAS